MNHKHDNCNKHHHPEPTIADLLHEMKQQRRVQELILALMVNILNELSGSEYGEKITLNNLMERNNERNGAQNE